MTAMGIEPPDGAAAEPVFVMHHNGAGNRAGFRIIRGEARLHVATVWETVARRPFHVGWEVPY